MLEIQRIRQQREQIIKGLKKRNISVEDNIQYILSLDDQRKKTQNKLDNILHESKIIAKKVGTLMKNREVKKANKIKSKTAKLKENAKELNHKIHHIEEELTQELYHIPNVPYHLVKAGKDEKDNEEVYRQGELSQIDSKAIPHWEIAKQKDIIDFETGTKITGAGFPIYKNKGAKLQRAIIQFCLDKNTNAGYTEYQVPLLINKTSGYGTGQLPDKEGQMYHTPLDNLYLIPTSEVPITNIFRDTILQEKDFPIKCTGYTPCFRREAGSYGKNVRGLNRLHQFDKVEIVQIQHPDKSYKTLDLMVAHVKELLTDLELPFRILRLCGGDTGFTSAMTYDFEVFSAVQKKWLEVSSVSNFETFQSNRLKLRFKNKEGNTRLCHTLNGSALALPRIVAAILENHQTKNGNIQIPKILQPYIGFNEI